MIPTVIGSWSSGTWSSCSTTRAPTEPAPPLPKPSIDTGAGLERILCLMQGVDAVWETDLMMPLIDQACSLTGKRYVAGDYEHRESFAMRVLAEHARSSTMLVSDGVFPSNEGRGYVLRRIIRRAVRYAYLLGTEKLVMPSLVETAVSVMGSCLPRRGEEPRLRGGRAHPRGRAFPSHPEDWPRHPRGRIGRWGQSPCGQHGLPPPRHLRLPARAHRGDSRRAWGDGRR